MNHRFSNKAQKDLKSSISSNYGKIFNNFTLSVSPFQGWASKAYIIQARGKRFFVKVFENSPTTRTFKPSQIRRSYEYAKAVRSKLESSGGNIGGEDKKKVKFGIPEVYENDLGDVVTEIEGEVKFYVIIEFFAGVRALKENEFPKYIENIADFFKWLHKLSREFPKESDSKRRKLLGDSESNNNSIKNTRSILNGLRGEGHDNMTEKENATINEFIAQYTKMCNELKDYELPACRFLFTHQDLWGCNLLLSTTPTSENEEGEEPVIYMVDWDRLSLEDFTFEKELVVFYLAHEESFKRLVDLMEFKIDEKVFRYYLFWRIMDDLEDSVVRMKRILEAIEQLQDGDLLGNMKKNLEVLKLSLKLYIVKNIEKFSF